MSYRINYLLLGLGFATVVEVINMGILQGNWVGMVHTLLIVYTIFIGLGFKIQRKFTKSSKNLAASFIIIGLIGLVGIEWVLIGTYPTSSQTLITIIIFQLGILIYWATVGFGPKLFLDDSPEVKPIKRSYLRFYVIWFIFVYSVGLLLPAGNLRFVFMQVFSALGHIILARYFVKYFKVRGLIGARQNAFRIN